MTLEFSPALPPDSQLLIRFLRGADLPTDAVGALRAASAKPAGGTAAGAEDGELLVGLADASIRECIVAGRKLAGHLAAVEELGSVTLDLASAKLTDRESTALLRGLDVGTYELGLWRGERPGPKLAGLRVRVTGIDEGTAGRVLAKAAALGAGQRAAMHLVDRPANAKKPRDVAAYARELGDAHGFETEVLDEEALEIQGFGGILAVGRASDHPPRLLKLHYRGGDGYHLGLVGKGVTFDTGGISIKPSQNMGYMKSDLGGAAAVLGAFATVAELGLPVELHGLLPVAENAVDGDAYLPSDVIRNYSGKTIEITDTDAEGRLLLADALAYLPEWCTPTLTIDLATLTGSAVRTFGYEAAALFTSAPGLVEQLAKAGEPHAERTWPLPLWESYAADLKSDVADVKHYHGKPIAGAINAAKFLEYFVADRARWAHLDIAGVAFGSSEFSRDKAATGYGVALLTQFLIDRLADA